MKTTKKIMSYLQNNPGSFFAILFFAFIFAEAYCDTAGWLMNPYVRLVLHAVSAFIFVQFFNMIGLGILLIAREIIGVWLAIIGQMKVIRKKTVMTLRKILKLITLIVCPFIGTGIYIAKSYAWEAQQAIDFERVIQMDQLIIDIVFSVISCIVWIIFFNRWAKSSYIYTPSECVLLVKTIFERVETIVIFENEKIDDKVNYFIQIIIVSVIVLIPIWVTTLAVILINCMRYITFWGLTA